MLCIISQPGRIQYGPSNRLSSFGSVVLNFSAFLYPRCIKTVLVVDTKISPEEVGRKAYQTLFVAMLFVIHTFFPLLLALHQRPEEDL